MKYDPKLLKHADEETAEEMLSDVPADWDMEQTFEKSYGKFMERKDVVREAAEPVSEDEPAIAAAPRRFRFPLDKLVVAACAALVIVAARPLLFPKDDLTENSTQPSVAWQPGESSEAAGQEIAGENGTKPATSRENVVTLPAFTAAEGESFAYSYSGTAGTAGVSNMPYRQTEAPTEETVVSMTTSPMRPSTGEAGETTAVMTMQPTPDEEPIMPYVFPQMTSNYGVDAFLEKLGEGKGCPCFNVTPPEITEKYGFTVFKFGLKRDYSSYLLYNDEIYMLGMSFGGFGVETMAIADADQDGIPELYYTYSWGSGIDHSCLATFFFSTGEEFVNLAFNDDPHLMLAEAPHGLSVYTVKSIEQGTALFPKLEPGEEYASITWIE